MAEDDYEEIRSLEMSLRAFEFIENGRLAFEVRTGDLGQITAVVSGECPRCGHFHQDSFSPNIVMGGQLRGATKGTTGRNSGLTHVVVCDCSEEHDGRPDNLNGGCGLRYLVEFELGGD